MTYVLKSIKWWMKENRISKIIDTMTARFGNFVNYKPPFQWNTALLWLLPILLLIGAFALILFSTKKSEGEPKQLENQPHTAPKEEKSAVTKQLFLDLPPSFITNKPES